MTTEDIADILELTAKLMELHEENPFKVKAVSTAAYKLAKTRIDLSSKNPNEIDSIEGIGKGITAKIIELLNTGTTQELEDLRAKTPAGVIEMMHIKGVGPKKVRQLWQELGVESVGELLYACHENRLVDLKGFGTKTQESIKQNIEFSLSNTGKLHFSRAEKEAEEIMTSLRKNKNVFDEVSFTGEMRRKNEIITKIEILAAVNDMEAAHLFLTEKKGFAEDESIENTFVLIAACSIVVYLC